MDKQERINWMLHHEHLWKDKAELKHRAIADGVYSEKLTNIAHFLDGLIADCKVIKRRCNTFAPLMPRTSLRITKENFLQLLTLREVIDILSEIKHPFRKLDRNGFTYYDYALYKWREQKRLNAIVDEINLIFAGGDIEYYV